MLPHTPYKNRLCAVNVQSTSSVKVPTDFKLIIGFLSTVHCLNSCKLLDNTSQVGAKCDFPSSSQSRNRL
jgi:hypothetical protein